jgi:hypothetical protein
MLLQIRITLLHRKKRAQAFRVRHSTQAVGHEADRISPRSSTSYRHSQPFIEQVAAAYPDAMRANTTAITQRCHRSVGTFVDIVARTRNRT